MKIKSLKLKLLLLGTPVIVILGIITAGYSISMFRSEINILYTEDYGERIKNMEFEYDDVESTIKRSTGTDSGSYASETVSDSSPAVVTETADTDTAATEAGEDWVVAAEPDSTTGASWEEGGASTGSVNVSSVQDNLLARLNERFITGHTLRGQPFIFNGDGKMVLFIEEEDFSGAELLDGILNSVKGQTAGQIELSINNQPYWVIYSYYNAWDWYTGFILADSVRFESLYRFMRNIIIAIIAVIAVFIIAYLWFLNRTLKPFALIPKAMKKFIEGDVNQQLAVRGHDEVASISQSFNDFVVQLKEILELMKQSCDNNTQIENELNQQARDASSHMQAISSHTSAVKQQILDLNSQIEQSETSAEKIGRQIENLNGAIDDQVSAVNQSTAAIVEISASLGNVASITAVKKQSSIDLTARAREGSNQLSELQKSIQAVNNSVEEIVSFVDVIKNIASQTNLLSMNASIEAAHAGESGKGFSVVADEIRKLAAEAAESSGSIGKVIAAIVEKIKTANNVSIKTGGVFEMIEKEIHSVTDSFQEIASSTDQLATGSVEITNAMNLLSDISSKVKQESEESIKASEEIVNAMHSVIESSEKMIQEISDIDKGTQEGASNLENISRTAGILSEKANSLHAVLNRFNLEDLRQ